MKIGPGSTSLKSMSVRRLLLALALALVLLLAGCASSSERAITTTVTTVATTTTTRPTTTTTRPTTTTIRVPSTLSEAHVRRSFWSSLKLVVQGGEDGIVLTMNRAIEASNARRWTDMGVECSLSEDLVLDWYLRVNPAPDARTQTLVDTFFDEVATYFYWCSGGTEGADGAPSGRTPPGLFPRSG